MTGTAHPPQYDPDPRDGDPGLPPVPAVPTEGASVMPALSTETTGGFPRIPGGHPGGEARGRHGRHGDEAPAGGDSGRHGPGHRDGIGHGPGRSGGTVYTAGNFGSTGEATRGRTGGPAGGGPSRSGRPPEHGAPPPWQEAPPPEHGAPPPWQDNPRPEYGAPPPWREATPPWHGTPQAARGTLYGRPAGPSGQAPVLPGAPVPGGEALPGGGPAPDREGDGGSASVARNSAMMAALSLVSRLTGALRTLAIAAALGGALVADDYNVANMLPNMLYELLLGGVLASVVVPLLVRARRLDADGGEAYTHRLLTLVAIILAAATVLAVIAAPVITAIMANSETTAADRRLTTFLAYLLLPEIFFYGMAAVLSAVLNTRHHFAAPMWTPILNNLVVIVTAGLFMLVHGTSTPQAGELATTEILILGIGTTLGIIVQALGLVPALRRVGFRWRWRWEFRELHLSQLGRIGGWALCYVAASQIGVVVVLWMARYAGSRGAPGAAVYLNAYLILMMAHGIVAVSIITALMPRLSAAASDHRYADVTGGLSLGTRLSAALLIPATVGYIVLGRPMAVVLFDWGAYGHEFALATGTVIAWSGLGLVPFAVSQLQMFTFYALPDTKTPALINIPTVGVRLGVDGLLLALLPVAAVVNGLMFGNAVSYALACALGYLLLRRRLGPLGLGAVGAALARMSVAAVLAGVAAGLVVFGLVGAMGTDKPASLLQLVLGAVVLLGGYLAAALVLRVREVTQVWEMVRSRLGR